jgi:hypothetical protein
MKLFKSKTLDFNAIVLAAFALLKGFGFETPDEVIVAVVTIVNFILRFFTDKPLSEK